MPASFILSHRARFFSFGFQAEDGQIILLSRFFRTQNLCRQGIAELILALDSVNAVEKLQNAQGQYSFVIRNSRKVTIGHSPVFYALSSRDYALRKLQQQAQTAIIGNIDGVCR